VRPTAPCRFDLDALSQGELDEATSVDARLHVAVCAACRAELEQLTVERRLFASRARARDAEPPVPSFEAFLVHRARPRPMKERATRWLRALSSESLSLRSFRASWSLRAILRGSPMQVLVASAAAVVLLVGVSRQNQSKPTGARTPDQGVESAAPPTHDVERAGLPRGSSVSTPNGSSFQGAGNKSVVWAASVRSSSTLLASSSDACAPEETVCLEEAAEARCSDASVASRPECVPSSANMSSSSSSEPLADDCGASLCVSESL